MSALGTQEQNHELFSDDDLDIEQVLDRIDDIADDPRAWPKTLTEFIDVTMWVLANRFNMSEEQARSQAQEVIVALSHHVGGRQIYFPRSEKLETAIRDNFIYREFNGTNHEGLAIKNKLTKQQIYNIIAQQKRLHTDRLQPQLFGE